MSAIQRNSARLLLNTTSSHTRSSNSSKPKKKERERLLKTLDVESKQAHECFANSLADFKKLTKEIKDATAR